jgi:hypothetical protein
VLILSLFNGTFLAENCDLAMSVKLGITGDLAALMSQTPAAVDSFSPGHWTLMLELERRARDVVGTQDVGLFIDLLCDTAFLKQPYRINREDVCRSLTRYPAELAKSLDALQHVDALDYQAMDCLAGLPWFGRNGGRAFNSAVLRLVCPRSFGIIDWRNLAVMTGAPGFEGLLKPTLVFQEFSARELLEQKGTLTFTKQVYECYNNALRGLAASYERTVAEIDVAVWTYSIQKRPFGFLQHPQVRPHFHISSEDRKALRLDHESVAKRIAQAYLERLKEVGYLRQDILIDELCSLFALIRDECEAFGRQKRGRLREKVKQVVTSLDRAIKTEDRYRLLSHWNRWEKMVDTTSPDWQGISLPADMVLERYLIFEDFEPVRSYLAGLYDPESLKPRHSSE